MSDYKPDYIQYRLSKAHEALQDAQLLEKNNSGMPALTGYTIHAITRYQHYC